MDLLSDSESVLPRLYLLGAFSLTDRDGTDRTPKNKKSRALLALLALSPRGTRTRIWLRDKLWSESDEERASGSLRQAIFDLKRSLEPLGEPIFSSDRNSITLHLEKVWVDLRAFKNGEPMPADLDPQAELLEGLDIADEEFEEWLMMERSAWETFRDDMAERPEATRMTAPVRAVRPSSTNMIAIGLLPGIVHGSEKGAEYIGDYIAESIARTLSEYQPVDIVDLRGGFSPSEDISAAEPDYLIRTRTLVVGDSTSVTFLVYEPGSNALLLSQSMQTRQSDFYEDEFALTNQFVAQNVDHLAKIILHPSTRRQGIRNDHGALLGYRLLAGMFDLDASKMETARQTLVRAQQDSGNALFPSLTAYASSFALGECLGGWDEARRDETEALARDVLQDNPFNSISLACVGHVMGFVLDRHDIAAEIFDRAVQLNPMQAFVWDHLSLHQMYCGDLEKARASSDRAVLLGNYSPISYTYETTACMIATLQGDHGRAVQLGRRALVKRPRFHAALRYTLAALGHMGNTEAAADTRARLLAIDPDFADREVQKERFRLPLPDERRHVLDGIAKAGL
ncbi:AfsR/SARP family transcriptional regulator [Litorisediminicola beolgyonensis]|uniref:Transcriptional regulator n=1 Tax=Litorisediminicola beolgyonensis TaxID=1173614 RepID=A0ABW3ZP65_9RHOB